MSLARHSTNLKFSGMEHPAHGRVVIVAMTARGMTVCEIQGYLAEWNKRCLGVMKLRRT
jgi:hypothetical protein